MKKLKLELDALTVESFTAGTARNPDGTVRGHRYVWTEQEEAVTVPREPISNVSCPAGCTDGCTAYSCASGAPVCCA